MAHPLVAARNLAALAWRRASRAAGKLSLRKRLARHRLREERRREQAAFVAIEDEALARIAALARDSRPIIAGPWLSEVGYEALYWVPFLRWAAAEHRILPERLIAVSRGGVSSWYSDVTTRYVDIFELLPPVEVAARTQRIRDEAASQKQLGQGELDAEIISRARARLNIDDALVLHPSVMYQLFRQFWVGNRSIEFVLQRLRHAAPRPDATLRLPSLPQHFVAVKLYTGAALPDTPANRSLVRTLVQRLAEDQPVVLLDSPRALDDHADFDVRGMPSVVTLDRVMTPANNLAVQTEVLRRAERFISTCGGLAWLAPLMGIDTVAVYSDDQFLATHLYLARQVYRRVPTAGSFAAVDLRGVETLRAAAPLA